MGDVRRPLPAATVTAGAAAVHETECGSIVSSVPIAFGLARTSATVSGFG